MDGVLQEVGEVSHQVLTAESLHKPNAYNNFCSSQINSLEAIPICETLLHPFLEFIRVFDHSNGFIRVETWVTSHC